VKGAKTYYRARFAGFDRDQAQETCKKLKRDDIACMALKL
jgi:D-alanyl-D-alanine carboxypeptidase